MKKFLSLVSILFITSFMGILSVKAAILSLDTNKAIVGGKVTLTISKATGNSGYTLSYDSNFLSPGNKNTCGSGNTISIEKAKSGCSIEFVINKNLSLTENKEIQISLIDDGASDVSSPATLTINANKKAEQVIPATTTQAPQEAPKSNNANLKTLIIKGDDDSDVSITPAFNPGVYEYSATVSGTVKTVQINATMEDAKANMVMSNNVNEELIAGENNKITITVTAEDGTKKAYVLNIKREALTADATLKELTIEESKSFKLKEDKFTYNVKVKKSVKNLTLDYVLSDENSSVEIEGNENLKDGSIVKVIVTAQDGTKKVYTLNISKEVVTTKIDTSKISTEKNPLIIMGLSIIAFGLIGGIIYVIKK